MTRHIALLTVLILVMSTVSGLAMSTFMFHAAEAQGNVKDMSFYFHFTPSAASTGGAMTNFIINSSYLFQNTNNSFYKGVGQPKISEDFYLYPSLAGAVELSGDWKVIIFANSTALHPATWGVEFWEKSQSGAVVWDSGALSPSVQGGPASNPGYVDSPIYGYTLTASNLTHSFSAGDTLQVEVTVNTGSTVPLSLWYDSQTYPSGVILPSMSYATPIGLTTQDVNGTARTTFFSYWSASQRQVIIITTVNDPFGGYDINKVLVQVTDPTGKVVVANDSMASTSGNAFSLQKAYQLAYPYLANATEGTYTMVVSVIDNNGERQFQVYGYYSPFIESIIGYFSIGVQVPIQIQLVSASPGPLQGALVQVYSGGLLYASGYTGSDGSLNLTIFTGNFDLKVFWEGVQVADQNVSVSNSTNIIVPVNVFDPIFQISSNLGQPVQGALVFITYPNGSTGRLPFTTDLSGQVHLLQQPTGNFSFLVFYEGVEVADTSLLATFNWSFLPVPTAQPVNPFDIKAQVYQLSITVLDDAGSRITNATILVSNYTGSSSLIYGYGLTQNGSITLMLPAGTYDVQAEYHNVWLLSYASNTTHVMVPLTTDETLTIKMTNIPPPIWVTLGFWMILVLIIVAAFVAYLFLRKRKI
jgi:hypothetical protein